MQPKQPIGMIGSKLTTDINSSMSSPPLYAAMVFSASLARELEKVRLPPNFVGVRRVRASNQLVRDALRTRSSDGSATNHTITQTKAFAVVFKVTEKDGTERRMTTQEKKEAKNTLRNERKKQKQESKLAAAGNCKKRSRVLPGEAVTVDLNAPTATSTSTSSADHTFSSPSLLHIAKGCQPSNRNNTNSHELEVNMLALEEELAELRGENKGVPPVVLSPCMGQQAIRTGVLPPPISKSHACALKNKNEKKCRSKIDLSVMDNQLARKWAAAIKDSMKVAEDARSKENMRPMAYQLIPEVWTRLRPSFESNSIPEEDDMTLPLSSDASVAWSTVTIRHRMDPFDSDLAIVYYFLQQNSNLHISCGSKFGCDLLLYDGPREERHAFGGLRVFSADSRGRGAGPVVSSTEEDARQLPLPSAYDLAGYVRCLNTAGKLALLATVQRMPDDPQTARIAIVDLALEKILTAPTHQKHRSRLNKKARREVGENLSKTIQNGT